MHQTAPLRNGATDLWGKQILKANNKNNKKKPSSYCFKYDSVAFLGVFLFDLSIWNFQKWSGNFRKKTRQSCELYSNFRSFLRHLMYIKHERQCFIGISTHREESWKYDAHRSIFDEIQGVWIADETLSRVFDIHQMAQKFEKGGSHFGTIFVFSTTFKKKSVQYHFLSFSKVFLGDWKAPAISLLINRRVNNGMWLATRWGSQHKDRDAKKVIKPTDGWTHSRAGRNSFSCFFVDICCCHSCSSVRFIF